MTSAQLRPRGRQRRGGRRSRLAVHLLEPAGLGDVAEKGGRGARAAAQRDAAAPPRTGLLWRWWRRRQRQRRRQRGGVAHERGEFYRNGATTHEPLPRTMSTCCSSPRVSPTVLVAFPAFVLVVILLFIMSNTADSSVDVMMHPRSETFNSTRPLSSLLPCR